MPTITGSHMILAIPLAAGGAGIVETFVLGSLLFVRLRSKVKTDRGMLRLERRRAQQAKIGAKQEDGSPGQSIKESGEAGENRIVEESEESKETST